MSQVYNAVREYRNSIQDLINSKNNSRILVQCNTISIANNQTANVDIENAAKSYSVLEVYANAAAWVRVYNSPEKRFADAARVITADPESNSGVILEVVTVSAEGVQVTPAVTGYTSNVSTIPLKITNKSGANASINVKLTLLVHEQ